mmetsp:Transcript_4215/g.6398  ORF Transcript_4215/g.6398 Transcript_4215/m.6398 type:complete len:226 (+) Transcript_4215:66-743(+)
MISSSSNRVFLDQLQEGKEVCGDGALVFFDRYLAPEHCQEALEVLNSDRFPWELKPKLYGVSLPQHAYFYDRQDPSKARQVSASPGLSYLEGLCTQMERTFDGTIAEVYCNRFQDPSHHIDWHKDTYGRHIFVLSLGREGVVEFRHNKTRQVEVMEPASGDLYFVPLKVNDTHKHRVLSNNSSDENEQNGTRLSFVFFFETPDYATKYRITKKDKVKGFWESLMS